MKTTTQKQLLKKIGKLSINEASINTLIDLREMFHRIDSILYQFRHVNEYQNIINTKIIDNEINKINAELDKKCGF